MPATYLAEITDEMIVTRQCQILYVSIQWIGNMVDDVRFNDEANIKLGLLKKADIRKQLERYALMGDTPQEEIDLAISLACEPKNFPANAFVNLVTTLIKEPT